MSSAWHHQLTVKESGYYIGEDRFFYVVIPLWIISMNKLIGKYVLF